jgi:hypothetical protein
LQAILQSKNASGIMSLTAAVRGAWGCPNFGSSSSAERTSTSGGVATAKVTGVPTVIACSAPYHGEGVHTPEHLEVHSRDLD